MSWNPKKGALDRQAGLPRVALRFATTRNPASISLLILHAESQSCKFIWGLEQERH